MAVPLNLSEVPNVLPYIQYVATNGQTVFPYPFPITQDADLVVIVNGVTQSTDGGYSLSGQGNATGGNVTFVLGRATGDIITFYRDIAIERLTQIGQNSGFISSTFNAEFNNIYLIMQQLEQSLSLCLQIPNTNSPAPVTTLAAAAYAGKFLSLDANGNPTPAALTSSGSITTALLASFLTPQTLGEQAVGVVPTFMQYPPGNVLRYGVVPNASGSSTANTAALQALVSASANAAGWAGQLVFPNTTGADVYWFNDLFDFRDNIYVELNGCTLQFTKSGTSGHDTDAGFIMAQRNFGIQNGAVNVNYTGGANKGAIFAFGARGSEAGAGAFYPNSYDSTLTVPQGNIYVRNIRATSNNPGGNIAQLTGGLDTVTFEDFIADGQSTCDGIDYEFGWATSGTTNLRQTSHGKNLTFRNCKLTNVTGGTGTALTLTGCYNVVTENVVVNGAVSAITASAGESLNYRPWVGVDDAGCKRTKRFINTTAQNISGTAMLLSGEDAGSGSYLSAIVANPPLTAAQLVAAETHLNDFVVDGFALVGGVGATGNGINISGGTSNVRNGIITGFVDGIISYDDATFVIVENVQVVNNTQIGINLAAGNSLTLAGTPVYLKKSIVRGCLVAGNSSGSAGTYPGISIQNCDGALIENNRFNFETAYPGEADETTQGNAIQLAANANNVICRNNRVGHVLGGSFAYYNVDSTAPGNGHVIDGATGIVTSSGVWDGVEQAWTPVLTCATPGNLARTYTTQAGGYTKKGNRVDYWAQIVTATFTHTSGESGNVQITGLPYPATTVTGKNQMGSVAAGGFTASGAAYTALAADVASGTQYIQFYGYGSGIALTHMVIADLPTGTNQTFLVSGNYFV